MEDGRSSSENSHVSEMNNEDLHSNASEESDDEEAVIQFYKFVKVQL